MKINVLELRKGPQEIDFDVSPEELKLEAQGFEFSGRVSGHVRFQMVSQRVLANGRLETVAEAPCGRCLGPSRFRLRAEVRTVFEKRPLVSDKNQGARLSAEWEAESREIDYYDEEVLDPTEAFRQLLLLELPNHPLCGEGCRGLCPHCGVDLNRETCRCAVEEEAATGEADWKNRIKKIKLS